MPLYPFLGEGSPTKIDYRKNVGTLILTSLLEDLAIHAMNSTRLLGATKSTLTIRRAARDLHRRVAETFGQLGSSLRLVAFRNGLGSGMGAARFTICVLLPCWLQTGIYLYWNLFFQGTYISEWKIRNCFPDHK